MLIAIGTKIDNYMKSNNQMFQNTKFNQDPETDKRYVSL